MPTFRSICKYLSHGNPNILNFSGLYQELLPLSLFWVHPVSGHTVINPGPLHVVDRGKFNKLASFGTPEIPHSLYILVLNQIFGEVFLRAYIITYTSTTSSSLTEIIYYL